MGPLGWAFLPLRDPPTKGEFVVGAALFTAATAAMITLLSWVN